MKWYPFVIKIARYERRLYNKIWITMKYGSGLYYFAFVIPIAEKLDLTKR